MDDPTQQTGAAVSSRPTSDWTPIDLKTYKWEPGKSVRIQTAHPTVYTFTVVKPVTFEELVGFVKDAIEKAEPVKKADVFKYIYEDWYRHLAEVNLLEPESFKAAADAQRAKGK